MLWFPVRDEQAAGPNPVTRLTSSQVTGLPGGSARCRCQQVHQGPPVRCRPKLSEPVPVRFPGELPTEILTRTGKRPKEVTAEIRVIEPAGVNQPSASLRASAPCLERARYFGRAASHSPRLIGNPRVW